MKLLLKNALVLTGDLLTPIWQDVHIGIEDEQFALIVEADNPDAGKLVADFNADRVLSAHDKIIMPGLINCHTHIGMSLMRNYGSDLNLQDWLTQKIFPVEANLTPDDIHWANLLEQSELIRSGCTGYVDMYYFPEIGAKNALNSGMRANISVPITGAAVDSQKSYSMATEALEQFNKDWSGRDNRLSVSAVVHSTYLPTWDALVEIGEFVSSKQFPTHIHLHETMKEIADSLEQYQKRPIQIASELGILNNRTVVAHGVHLTDEDRSLLKKHDVLVAHCPTSNLKLASGVADMESLWQKEIRIGLGTDGASSNNNLNMFEELHLAALLEKGFKMDPLLMPAVRMVHIATQQAATALNQNPLLGHFVVGAPADLIMLSRNEPHWFPLTDPVAAVVYSAQAADVDTVMVAGKILMEKRQMMTIDMEQAKWQVNRAQKRLLDF